MSACAPHVPAATAAQRAQVQVTLYTTQWCPVCTRARSWLHSRGIPFRELDVERRPSAAARHAQLNPARTVPTFDIEGQVIVGFVSSEVRQAIDRVAHTYPARAAGQVPRSAGAEQVEPPAAPQPVGPEASDETRPNDEPQPVDESPTADETDPAPVEQVEPSL